MKGSDTARGLAAFLESSPSCFHAVANMRDELLKNGFTELQENQKWQLRPGGKYFVTRNSSALIAFTIPDEDFKAFRIIASHSDSPSFKIKENPELETDGHYIRLNTERYGGMLCAPWFDRPLSVAGRVIVKDPADDTFRTKLVNIDRDLLLIRALAIHMNREANNGYKYDMKKGPAAPSTAPCPAKTTFMKTVAEAAGVNETEILGHDLFLYNRKRPASGARPGSSSPAAGWTTCSAPSASLRGFLTGKKETYAAVHCVLDNEETGSTTKQGAASTFLSDTLERICGCLDLSREDYLIRLSESFMLSADNAHAVHPNHPDKADPSNPAPISTRASC